MNSLLKLSHDTYLRSGIVLAIDCFVSMVASLFVLAVASLISSDAEFPGRVLWLTWLGFAALGSAASFYGTRLYRAVIRYSGLKELGQMFVAILGKELAICIGVCIFQYALLTVWVGPVLLLMDLFVTLGGLIVVRLLMLVVYRFLLRHDRDADGVKRVLVYGIGEKSAAALTRLRNSKHYDVLGFIVPEEENHDNVLMGLPILSYSGVADVVRLERRYRLDGVLFAYPQHARKERDGLVEYARQADLKLFVAPGIDEIREDMHPLTVRKVNVEDLLGRSEINIAMDEVRKEFEGKCVMVTGAAGSIGSELCRQLAKLGVRQLVMFDNAESPLHAVRLEFEERWPDLNIVPVIGDVRMRLRLDYVFRKYKPQIVFHAAAYKHVPLMEENPCEAVLVNVGGSANVADKCVEYGVERMVMISTDKAVNPTNIMGCTKRLAEIYVQSLGLALERGEVKGNTTFVTTRFGNVLGSNGSVIPRFQEQIEKGGPVTVTDPEIRRFFMTIPEACRLVMEAATMATGTQIFVFDMGEPVKIVDLARRMIHLAGFEVDTDIKIEFSGLRPGEKLYEEVLATKENTIPTPHERIFVARVREYPYADALRARKELAELSVAVDIPTMVRLMKRIVPEFKSEHSPFEVYDHPEGEADNSAAPDTPPADTSGLVNDME